MTSEENTVQQTESNRNAIYYRIGSSISVRTLGPNKLLCLTCRKERCKHTRIVEKYRAEPAIRPAPLPDLHTPPF